MEGSAKLTPSCARRLVSAAAICAPLLGLLALGFLIQKNQRYTARATKPITRRSPSRSRCTRGLSVNAIRLSLPWRQ